MLLYIHFCKVPCTNGLTGVFFYKVLDLFFEVREAFFEVRW